MNALAIVARAAINDRGEERPEQRRLTPCPRSSRSVFESLYWGAHRASLRSHSLTPLGQIWARLCSPKPRRQGTVS